MAATSLWLRAGAACIAGLLAACTSVGDALSNETNPGPCPNAFALHDAARKVDFIGDDEVLADVAYTAEFQSVRSLCRYRGDGPIRADLELEIGFGRGPAAESNTHTYTYFVAVTRRDLAVIHKEVLPIEVRFPRGEDRVFIKERVDEILIPRAGETVSGGNFEILVGFELTEKELAFNRLGKRFLVDAGSEDN